MPLDLASRAGKWEQQRAQAGPSLAPNLKSLPLCLHPPGICLLLVAVTEGAQAAEWCVVSPGVLGGAISLPPNTGPNLQTCPSCPCPSGFHRTSLS